MGVEQQQIDSEKRGLVVLATRIAEQLVQTALEGFLTEATSAAVVVGDRRVRLTLSPPPPDPPARRLLGPGRDPKKGKPAKRKYTRRATSAAPAASGALASKMCRKCFKRGPVPVPGTPTIRCTSCGFTWTPRAGKIQRRQAAKAPSVKGDACWRCDHSKKDHENGTGRCLAKGCTACESFYQ